VDALLESFSESISFDQRLFREDIAGSTAHARMLAQQGLLTSDESDQIAATLADIENEISAGEFAFRAELEDIHMHIEAELINRLGDTGRKLHTARSRNDQVATDIRLWLRSAIDRVDLHLETLQRAFVDRCDEDLDMILPAYTHLRRAQPVVAAHYWLAYCEKFARDRDRLADCRKRLNVSPLGTAALAGTSLPIDRHATAASLGFASVSANSLDTSSDRDFVIETAFCLTLIAEHLSTWADEWILWSSEEFQFLELPHQFCTGSSIMPQKINPDTLELIRGKTARVIGNLQTLLVLVKGMPLTYHRDFQEDKPPIFDSVDTVEACLRLAAPVVQGAKLKPLSPTQLNAGFLDATTLMEYLIRLGTPQRTAHHAVGAVVAEATKRNCALRDLPLDVLQSLAGNQLDEQVYGALGVEAAVAAFCSYGSTAPAEVRKQLAIWKERLGSESVPPVCDEAATNAS
jgi:argininosuccinate lyase